METDYGKHSTESIHTFSSWNDSSAKVCGKRKRVAGTPHRRHQRPEDVPWTAARCNRLLRTITSRIQILRRLSENNFADKAAARQSPARRKIIFKPESKEGGRISPDGVENVRSQLAALSALESPTKDGTDPEWLPDEGRKSSQRTYGGKGNKSKKVKIEEPTMPTKSSSIADFRSPFIKQILRTEAANSPTNHITDTPRRLTSHKIVLDPKTHAERALRTLLDSFSTVLSTTACAPPGRKLGAGSLRNMCLRKVPDYIDYEQQHAYDEEEYDFDATETVYLHLEEKLGTGSWTGLRTVVRAHAVKMIADAMDERSWPVESLDRLLDVCERNQAVEEGQQILRSWLMKAEGRGLDRVAKVLAWSKILDCTGFFFKTLRDTLESGCGLLDEFSECPGIWQDLLKALARKSTRADAAEFLEAYTRACLQSEESKLSGLDRPRLHERLKRDETFHNIMVLVTALCWTIDDTSPSSSNVLQSLTSQVHRMAINVCRDAGTQSSRTLLRGIEPLLTSSIVLHALKTDSGLEQPQLPRTDMTFDTVVSDILLTLESPHEQGARFARAEFVCSTAKCIAHASQSSANGFIYDLSTSLLLLATRLPDRWAKFFKRFAVNTAATWADYRADQASYVFADEVERAAFYDSPGKQFGHTSGSAQKPKVFRFEEAIGEWIAATPLASTKLDAELWTEDKVTFGSNERLRMEASPPPRESNKTTFGQEKIHWNYLQIGREDSRPGNLSAPTYLSAFSSRSLSSPTDKVHDERSTVEDCAQDRPEVQERLTTSANLGKSKSAESIEQSMQSPLQAKALRYIPDQPQPGDIMERDELAATPYNKELVRDTVPVSGFIKDESTPETPVEAFKHARTQTTLALRPRLLATQRTEDAALLERDELAATPAHQGLWSLIELEPDSHIVEQRSRSEAQDKLKRTPSKQPMLSTRVLRSAKQKTASPFQEYDDFQPCDELAPTPAQRVRALPRKTKVAKQDANKAIHFTRSGERDELVVTPSVSRTLRSHPKQVSKAKERVKLRAAKARVEDGSQSPSDPTGRRTKLPLGARSANIRTAAVNGKKHASDDELGL